MLQTRIGCSPTAIESTLNTFAASLNALSLCSKHPRPSPLPGAIFVRYASHATQGRANGPKDSAGRRLGAKKSESQFVVPGNIIFKQRGTKWFPGENVGMGKDHTIYATETGYVRYYRDPKLHPKRSFVGVALERDGKRGVLPTPENAPTRRRLGMYASPIKNGDMTFLETHLSSNSEPAAPKRKPAIPPPVMRQGTLMQREANFEIGRAAEKKGIKVRDYDRGDRWIAWKKRAKKVKKAALARAAKATRKSKGKKANKAVAGAGPGRKR